MSRVVRGLLLLLLFAGCRRTESRGTRSFYFWSGEIDYNEIPATDSLLALLRPDHFYVHFLDVDWSEGAGQPVPTFETGFYHPFYAKGDYTPVVFITPRSFERMSSATEVDSLAARLVRKLLRMHTALEERVTDLLLQPLYNVPYSAQYQATLDSAKKAIPNGRPRFPAEIQIDCDWTVATRDRYFRFLKAMKRRLPGTEVSVTVRLYPYKYRKRMGVPPADRGLLMCYNLSPVKAPSGGNSILDPALLRQYLDGSARYPLPLDAALPLFRWCAWERGGTFKGLLHDLAPEAWSPGTLQLLPDAPGRQYRVLRDTTLGADYLRAGDLLRDERVPPEAVAQADALVRRYIPKVRRTAFFSWQPSIAPYASTIQAIYRCH